MKRPNGNGSVVKLKGRRRHPYAAKITKWDTSDDGSPIQRRIYIGYFSNRMEAENALYKYATGDFQPPKKDAPTFGEIYQKFLEHTEKTCTPGTLASRKFMHAHFERLDNMRIDRIRYPDLQELIDKESKICRKGTMKVMKSALVLAFDYAVRMEHINENPARKIQIEYADDTSLRERKIFSKEEICKLKNDDSLVSKQILVMIYTGMRIAEATSIKISDVDLENRTISITASKTKAGLRTIPIMDQIYPIVEDFCKNNVCGYLLQSGYTKINYSPNLFRIRFMEKMKELNMNHIPHETRHTFATMLYNAGLDDFSIKMLVGHTDANLTKNIYTHQTVEDLAKKVKGLE